MSRILNGVGYTLSNVGNWLSAVGREREQIRERHTAEEKLAGGPRGVVVPNFLPYWDDTSGESTAQRTAYRRMMADPNIKAAFLGKVFAVTSLEPQFHAAKKKDKDAKLLADFCNYVFTERCTGGTPTLAWNILSGGLIDGYSVCENVRVIEMKGKWRGKYVSRHFRPLDVNRDLVLETDEFRNVVSLKGMRWNAGEVFDARDFVIWANLPMYGAPWGQSDFRAIYGRYWILDTAIKLRGIGAEKRAFPVIVGHYKDAATITNLQNNLALLKSQNWITAPESARIEALDVARSSETYFASLIKDLREEIVFGIAGAVLQLMPSAAGQQRGNSETHKDASDLLKWHLQQELTALFNDREHGLIVSAIDPNFNGVEGYPTCSFGGIDEERLANSLTIDSGLRNNLGWPLSREEIEERYGRKWAEGEDAIPPPAAPASTPGADVPNAGKAKPGGNAFPPPDFDDISVLTAPLKRTLIDGSINGNGHYNNGNGHVHAGTGGPARPFRGFREQTHRRRRDHFQWTEDIDPPTN